MPDDVNTLSPRDALTPDPGAGSRSRHRRGDPAAAIKSLAKTMARDTTAPIADRHLRAEVRTLCYNQMVAVLLALDGKRRSQRARYNRSQTIMATIIALLVAALGAALLI